MKTEKEYVCPALDIMEVEVESGFAQTILQENFGNGGNLEGETSY